MNKFIITTIAAALISTGCHTEGSLNAETPVETKAKQDPRDRKIAELEQRLEQTNNQFEELLKAQKGTRTAANADGIITPKGYEDPAAKLLLAATKPQRPRPLPRPVCGQVGPGVTYIDNYPIALERANCSGNCTTVYNTTLEWVSIESAGGEKKLICGGFVSLLSSGIDPEVSTTTPVEIAVVPPGRSVKWLNDSGMTNFVIKRWHRERDNSLKYVGKHISTPIEFPYRTMEGPAVEGMRCDALNC